MYQINVCSRNSSSWIRHSITMLIKIILISRFLLGSAYNIDTNHPLLYPNDAVNADQYPRTRYEHSYFGYSVLLHRDSQENTSWLVIGAPRGNYTQTSHSSLTRLNEPGVVYRCTLPGPCVEIEPIIEDKAMYISQRLSGHINNEHSWFGGAMSIEKSSGFLTVCAPRTIMSIILDSMFVYAQTMQGMCYSDRVSSMTLKAEISEIVHFDYSKSSWANPIHGFSVNFASLQGNETISRVVGRPNDNVNGSINVAHFTRQNFLETYRNTTSISMNDDLSLFGYSVTSGFYFNRNQSLYACADPGWNYVGQVTMIDSNNDSMISYVRGSDIGEFFGASLATGDLNRDGLHDLVVGAPHWGNDNGRVHVYLGSLKGKFEAAAILEGASEDAQFGYTVASGDLDGDGFSDIIVGAPWEESGVIYVYNGDASLKDRIKPVVSQTIAMHSNFRRNFPAEGENIRTFGFSISEPVDVDGNGYADIAVGAYKSGHVIILRSKPVVRTNLAIYTVPNTLERNDSNFSIKACVEYRGYNMANKHAFKISLIIDKRYKRTKETSLVLFSTDPPVDTCVNANVTLLNNTQDFIEPITIYASHDFTHNDSSVENFCETCPIEKLAKSKSAQILLPFDIECGEDRVCNSNISGTVRFRGVRDNNWLIGSNDIILEVYLENHAEPAYLATIVFIFPDNVVLRSILPFCEEEHTERHSLIVRCNVANPLGTNKKKVVKLDLDMKYLTNGSLHGRVLEFSTEIRTRSVNHGTHIIKSPLTLQSEASLVLNGKALEESYYLSDLDKEALNITLQHTYQILKVGATPIEKAQLIVDVPTLVDESGSLIFLYKPRIYIAGEYYDCFSSGINLIDVKENKVQDETASDLFNLHEYNSNNNEILHENVTHSAFRRDLSRTILMARILATVYNGKLEDSNGNLTTREHDIAYLNCSTHGLSCSRVHCDLSFLKTQQDVGKLVLRLILNATKLKDNFGLSDEIKIVKYSTDAYVEIVQPANRISSVDACNVTLTTEFHRIMKMQRLQMWVMFVSVSLGLILLCIVISILSTVGFFKRKTKEELSALTSKMEEENEQIVNI
ncbi:integrin alpha-PS3 isoform X2 [Ooceraea biroi]|uniref:integrin alpha-PS3 isoform X2 n=1 Tax=Ooceraea biroi TaxID=2015173 RepID=UPI0005BE0D6D|nr:integrin alpha-PS3 isoform X2 [Ooceraea biroi]